MLKKIIITLTLISIGCAALPQELPRIEFKDACLPDAIELLSKKAGLDVIFSGDSGLLKTKRVNLDLSNSSPKEAIEYILQANGLSCEKKGKTLLISTLPQDQEQSAYKGIVKTVMLKHLPSQKVSELILKLFPKLKASAGLHSNTLVLKGKTSIVKEAEDLVGKIDHPTPQVLIEAQVIELSQSGSQRLGFLYGKEAGTFSFITDKVTGKTEPSDNLLTTLHLLIGEGQAQIKASPRIATLDDHEAIINIGNRIPYAVPYTSTSGGTQWTVDYIDAGVKLKITPRIGDDGQITSFIQPEVSSISEWRTTSAGDFPVISTRNASATLRVKDGETIIIGGLISEAQRENVSKVPVLGYIPIIGLLFQNKNAETAKSEIVFLITPHLI